MNTKCDNCGENAEVVSLTKKIDDELIKKQGMTVLIVVIAIGYE